MKIEENLSVYEAEEYAKDNGFDNTTFKININGNYVVSGKFLDAYYSMIQIPVLGSGFTRFADLQKEYGDRNISIDIVDEEEFKLGVSFDFILRGKYDSIPEEYRMSEQ